MNPSVLDEIRSAIAKAAGAGQGLFVPLESPPEHLRELFDLACPIGFLLAAQQGRKPIEIAQTAFQNWVPLETVAQTNVHPPAYLNVRLSAKALAGIVEQILKEQNHYPQGISPKDHGLPKSILLEFCSANPTGPLHCGHGRGAVLGDTLSRIWRQVGITVHREYYINDVGTQIERLGRSLAARYRQEVLGETNFPFPQDGYGGEYLTEMSRRLKPGLDPNNITYFSDIAKKELLVLIQQDLTTLGVQFDQWYSESTLHQAGKVEKTLEALRQGGFVEEKEGAWWFVAKGLSDEDKDRVLKKSDGRSTYFASDLAYHQDKLSRHPELCLNIWGADHHGYVPRIKLGLEALGLSANRFDAILIQMVRLMRAGQPVKLSKRSGESLSLAQTLDEVGNDALRFFLNSRSPNAQMEFDLELAKKQSMENPVYLVQYAHARICSIEREKAARNVTWPAEATALSALAEEDPKTRALTVTLALLPDTLITAAKRRSAHYLSTYLIDLARLFHGYYETHPILSEPNPALAASRWRLCLAVRQVLQTSLSLLGVSAPDKM